jgi:hypothetical protein
MLSIEEQQSKERRKFQMALLTRRPDDETSSFIITFIQDPKMDTIKKQVPSRALSCFYVGLRRAKDATIVRHSFLIIPINIRESLQVNGEE